MAGKISSQSVRKDQDHAILRLIAANDGPVGQVMLSFLLRNGGFSLSAATVGRRLNELEFRGLLSKVSVEGRVITEDGLKVLERWNAEAKLQASGQQLLETLKQGDKKHILDLLSARRVVERETAALAARYATLEVIQSLEATLERLAQRIAGEELGLDEDSIFHQEIARASRNAVLQSLVALLRSHERYNLVIGSIRKIVGARIVEDHTAILEAIKEKSPDKSRDAMDQHLVNIMNDIDRYA